MHAPSGRYLGQIGAAAAFALLLVGCRAGSSDQAALQAPGSSLTTSAPAPGSPGVTFSGEDPHVAGHPAASEALARVAAGVSPGCVPRAERADAHLVSVVWHCGTRISAATVTLSGRPLGLSDILSGGYAGYLSSVAQSQFQAEGVPNASTADLSTWYLTPAALDVVFRDGIVSYPLPSLAPYIRDPKSL